MSYEKATIMSTLSKIQSGELVLPAIQRDFVWEPVRMYKLLDSIFRGYPFSTLLFWNTKQRIQFREYTKDWVDGMHFTYQIKSEGKKGTMVLDGQQRLQTLYLSLFGSFEQKILYFDLLSGIEPDDISEAKYKFEFLSTKDADFRNQEHSDTQYWIPLRDLANLISKQIAVKSVYYLKKIGLTIESESGQRLTQNISTAFSALRVDESLNYFTIDKDYGEDGLKTNLDEILEIFVRVNSGGQVLSKSDLMFSLMQMHWEDAADAISDLIDRLNSQERYDFDKDFILKVALVCTDHGARYEVAKLRNEKNIKEIRQNFARIAESLIQCKEFIVNKARFLDDRILRSYNTLIPFVYYFYLQPKQTIKSEETLLRMNHALYISLMTAVFSRYADNYIDHVVNNILLPSHKRNPGVFPIDEFLAFIQSKQGYSELDDKLLQDNISYLMNILEGGTNLPEGRRSRRPEIDHIFPHSKLLGLGYPEDQVNHYANFRLISKYENNWKRAQDPGPYFSANPMAVKRYLIPPRLFKYDQFSQFIEKRRELIWKRLYQFFGINQQFPPDPPEGKDQHLEPFEENSTRKIFDEMMEEDLKNLPILSDKSQWIDVFKQVPFPPNWSSRYHRELRKIGIKNVGDFAAAIIALRIKVTHISYDLPVYKFIFPLPDGTDFNVPTRGFGGYAWKWALNTLEDRGFEWKPFVNE